MWCGRSANVADQHSHATHPSEAPATRHASGMCGAALALRGCGRAACAPPRAGPAGCRGADGDDHAVRAPAAPAHRLLYQVLVESTGIFECPGCRARVVIEFLDKSGGTTPNGALGTLPVAT